MQHRTLPIPAAQLANIRILEHVLLVLGDVSKRHFAEMMGGNIAEQRNVWRWFSGKHSLGHDYSLRLAHLLMLKIAEERAHIPFNQSKFSNRNFNWQLYWHEFESNPSIEEVFVA